MSGLALCWSRRHGASVDPELVNLMEAALPIGDGERVVRWSRGPVGIVQASKDGAGPWTDPDGTILLLDGRLDSTRDVGLRHDGERTTLARHNQVALRAARSRWQARFLEHLIGDYALLAWQPSSETMIGARDPVGVRPLYYGIAAGGDLVIATALACVLAHPRLERAPNEAMVAEILANDVVSREDSLYRDVQRLPAGHVLEVQRDRVAVRCFRQPEVPPLLRYGRQEEYEEHYRAVLGEAVSDRLRGPGAVAMELSGGLDSSSVTALAADELLSREGQRARTYSLVYPGLVDDERPYIEAMATFHHLDGRVIQPSPPPRGRLAREVELSGGLPDPPNLVGWEQLLRTAGADGFESVLTGSGGDQRFETSLWHPAEMLSRGQLRGSAQAARRLSPQISAARAVAIHSVRPLAGSMARHLHLRRGGSLPPWIRARFAEQVGLTDRLRARPTASAAAASRIATALSGEEASTLEVLARCADRCGIHYRHPFQDLRVIEFAAALPEAQRWVGGEMRAIQRRSMAERLPPLVRFRTTKADFSRLFSAEFKRQGGRRRFADLTIAERGWVEPEVVLRLYDELETTLAATGSPEHIWPLWQVLAVDEWAKQAFAQT